MSPLPSARNQINPFAIVDVSAERAEAGVSEYRLVLRGASVIFVICHSVQFRNIGALILLVSLARPMREMVNCFAR